MRVGGGTSSGSPSVFETEIGLPALYNLYNAAGAVCAYTAAGFPASEIFSALGYSDNVRIMDLCSKYEPAQSKSDIGTEFILISKKDKRAINDILFGTTES